MSYPKYQSYFFIMYRQKIRLHTEKRSQRVNTHKNSLKTHIREVLFFCRNYFCITLNIMYLRVSEILYTQSYNTVAIDETMKMSTPQYCTLKSPFGSFTEKLPYVENYKREKYF